MDNIVLDQALVAGQTIGQSLFQATIIILFLVFLVWTTKLALE